MSWSERIDPPCDERDSYQTVDEMRLERKIKICKEFYKAIILEIYAKGNRLNDEWLFENMDCLASELDLTIPLEDITIERKREWLL